MKIRSIRATPVNLPLEAPYLWSYGSLAGFTKTIVEVTTEDGIIGYGEGPSHANVATIEKQFAPRLIGRDALDITGAEELCLPSWHGVGTIDTDLASIRAFAAIEMALWDIRGKAWGLPLHKLVGGAHRTLIPVADYFSFRERAGDVGGEVTPEAVLDYCLSLKERFGTTIFEGKLSTADPAISIRMMELLRAAMPEAVLRIDSNKAYSVTAARRLARALEPLDIRNWEDPVMTFEGMAELRKSTAIPFSSHTPDLMRALETGAPDAFCTDINVHGGIGRTLRFIGACEHTERDFWFYSGDSGIASSVYLHLSAALPHVREPSQSLYRMQAMDVTEEGPFKPIHSHLPVPTGPGLGVTLSADKLAWCHRHFVDHGAFNKFHDPDRPGVMRRLPLS